MISNPENNKHFYLSATPVPLMEDMIDIEDETVRQILFHPSYRRYGGWNMDFTDMQSNLKPFSDGLEKSSDIWKLRLFRNGYMEFLAVVDYTFSWNQDEQEFKTSPQFNPYAIIEITVSFIRLLKELVQKKQLTKSYFFRMAYRNCGLYKLKPGNPESIGYKFTSKAGEYNLDDRVFEKSFKELDMLTDRESFFFIERFYNAFGFSRDQIPFFKDLIFAIKK